MFFICGLVDASKLLSSGDIMALSAVIGNFISCDQTNTNGKHVNFDSSNSSLKATIIWCYYHFWYCLQACWSKAILCSCIVESEVKFDLFFSFYVFDLQFRVIIYVAMHAVGCGNYFENNV